MIAATKSHPPRSVKGKRPKKTKPAKPAGVRYPPAAGPVLPLPGDLKRRLLALRRRYRLVTLGTGLSILLMTASILLVAQALADWWFDLPWMARAVFLFADVLVLGNLFLRRLYRPLRKRLGLSETALMVEKKWKQLQQSVISAVQLAEGTVGSTRGSPELLAVLFQQARARTTTLNFKEIISTGEFWRRFLLAAVAMLGAATLGFVTFPPSLALVERIFLLPVPRPTQTIVVPITRDLTVLIGSDVEISTSCKGIIPTHGRVAVTYKGAPPQEYPVTASLDNPSVFRLSLHNVQQDLTYIFYLHDGHGPEFTVTARVAPTITELSCTEVYPDYTKLPPQQLPPTGLALLVGGHLKLQATASTTLKSASVILQGLGRSVPMTLDGDGSHLHADLPIPAKGLTGISLHLVDDRGVASSDETIYQVELVQDSPPLVKMLEPEGQRETITLRATPHVVFDASDDYGLVKLTLKFQLIPPSVNGVDAKPGSVQSVPFTIKPADQGQHYDYTFNVTAESPPWHEGWTVNYWIEAVDNNTATGPGITQTDHKQFGILSPEEKMAELLQAQKETAEKIDKISETQDDINKRVREAIPQK